MTLQWDEMAGAISAREMRVVASSPGQENNRTSMVSVRLAPDEEAALKAEAAAEGETLSQFIRNVLLRRREATSRTFGPFPYPPVSSTAVAGGLAVEAQDGQLVPRTMQPYVSYLPPDSASTSEQAE
jgi:hypothetical protein